MDLKKKKRSKVVNLDMLLTKLQMTGMKGIFSSRVNHI